jgi:hypothetical protein
MILGYLEMLVSPIALSILLLIYLIVFEFGNKRIRRVFLPTIVVFAILFCIIFVQNIVSKI